MINAYNTIVFLGLGTIDDFWLKLQMTLMQSNKPLLNKCLSFNKPLLWGYLGLGKFKNGKGSMITAISTNRLQNIFSRYKDNTRN